LSFEIIERLIHQYTNSTKRHIRLTGGEPFMHPNIKDIIVSCYTNKIETTIVTNGTLCPKETIQFLKNYDIASLGFSVHTYNSKTHEKLTQNKGSFQKLQNAIIYSVEAGIKTNIYYPISYYNSKEIKETLFWLDSLGVNQIKILKISPFGKALSNGFMHFSQHQWSEIINLIENLSKNLKVSIKIQGYKQNENLYYSGKCTVKPLNFLNINNIGEIYPCCLLMNDPKFKIGSLENLLNDDWSNQLLQMKNNLNSNKIYCNNSFPCLSDSETASKKCPILTNLIANV
jgi:radical SAM protein with 4Fe4S-binding SPASM domain